jgi:hypothetical protein
MNLSEPCNPVFGVKSFFFRPADLLLSTDMASERFSLKGFLQISTEKE